MKRTPILILGSVAVVALIALFLVKNDGWPESNTAGTIGAADTTIAGVTKADRYRTDQIADADVSIDDPEIQQILQDDKVQEMISDGTFAAVVKMADEGSLQRTLEAFGDESFAKAFRENFSRTARGDLAKVSRADLERVSRENDAEFARTLRENAAVLERVQIMARTGQLEDFARIVKAADLDRTQRGDLAKAARSADLAKTINEMEADGSLQRVLALRKAEMFDRVNILARVNLLDRAPKWAEEGMFSKIAAWESNGHLNALSRMHREQSLDRVLNLQRTEMGRTLLERTALQRTQLQRTQMDRTNVQ